MRFICVFASGYREAPKCISGRVLASFWWMFVAVILFSYSSNLTALFLATGSSKPTIPFKTFSEMAHQSDVVYGGWFGLILNPNDQLQRTMERSGYYSHQSQFMYCQLFITWFPFYLFLLLSELINERSFGSQLPRWTLN